MIAIKTPQQIASMRKGGKILGSVLFEVLSHIKPGVSEIAINDMADKLIQDKGGFPGFKKVKGYQHAICIATNEVVVHGIPTQRVFQEGDVVCVDCGVFLDGLHTDMAETVIVRGQKGKSGNVEKEKFLHTGKKALEEAIKVARSGNRVGDISQAIQRVIEGGGYSVVRNLVGHGVGAELHEEPEIPGFLEGKLEKTPVLREGMTIAIEAIYAMGKPDVEYASNDGWTIKTSDNSLSGVFERTILITDGEPEILTR